LAFELTLDFKEGGLKQGTITVLLFLSAWLAVVLWLNGKDTSLSKLRQKVQLL
jgi:hypothetical protein